MHKTAGLILVLFSAMEARVSIIQCLRARVDELAEKTTDSIWSEVSEFGPIRDIHLRQELKALATPGIALLVEVIARTKPPTTEELGFIRERAQQRARQLVPLSALLHSYLIANRVVGQAITAEAGTGLASLRAALRLTAMADLRRHQRR